MKTIFRTIPIDESPRLFVWTNAINWNHQGSVVQAIPINRQPVKTIFRTIPIYSLRDHLPLKFKLNERTRHRLFRQFQLMDRLKSIVRTIPINRVQHHLTGQFQWLEGIRHQLFKQLQLINNPWRELSEQIYLVESLRNQLSTETTSITRQSDITSPDNSN